MQPIESPIPTRLTPDLHIIYVYYRTIIIIQLNIGTELSQRIIYQVGYK